MNAKNIDKHLWKACTQIRTWAQHTRKLDDRQNLSLLIRAALCIYAIEMLANGFRIGTSPTPLPTTEPANGYLREK